MKLTAKQYAVALYEMTKDVSEKEASKNIGLFVKALMKAHRVSLLPKILLFYSDFYNKEEGRVDVEIKSAMNLSKAMKDAIKKSFPNKEVEMKEKIDEGLIGGAVFRWGDFLIDCSLKKSLENLHQILNK